MGKTWVFTADAFDESENNGSVCWSPNVRYAVWVLVKRRENRENRENRESRERTLELRGYVEFNTCVRRPIMKTALRNAVFSKRQRTAKDAVDSVLNATDVVAGPWEHGSRSTGESKDVRDDIIQKLAELQKDIFTLKSLQGDMADLKDKLDNVIARPPVPTTTTIVNNQINMLYTNANFDDDEVRDLGDEDLSDFPDDRLRELILDMDLMKFIRETRFNPSKPQNRNIRIVDLYRNRARLKKRGMWHEGTIAKSLEEVISKCVCQFFVPLLDNEFADQVLHSDRNVHRWIWHTSIMSRKRKVWEKIKSDVRGHLIQQYKLYDHPNRAATSMLADA